MMNKLLAGLALAVSTAGCASVIVSSPGTLAGVDVNGAGGRADRVLMVSNEGYFLFHCLPLVSGDLTWVPAERTINSGSEFFKNHLTGDAMMGTMCRYADSMDCDLVDIVVNDKNECPLGLFSLQEWVNTVIAYRSITYSGVLCPRKHAAKGGVRK